MKTFFRNLTDLLNGEGSLEWFKTQVNSWIEKDENYCLQDEDFSLRDVIALSIQTFGEKANLNWIGVSNQEDLSGLFYGLKFSGDISKWKIKEGWETKGMLFGCNLENDHLPQGYKKQEIHLEEDIVSKELYESIHKFAKKITDDNVWNNTPRSYTISELCEKRGIYNRISTFNIFIPNEINLYLKNIPVHLVRYDEKEYSDENADVLGLYRLDNKEIYLFTNKIDECCHREDRPRLVLKVLLHEMMHALMDFSAHSQYWWNYCPKKPMFYEVIPYSKQCGKWAEEAMANACTLYLILKHGLQEDADYSKSFMLNKQSGSYRLGAYLADEKDLTILMLNHITEKYEFTIPSR